MAIFVAIRMHTSVQLRWRVVSYARPAATHRYHPGRTFSQPGDDAFMANAVSAEARASATSAARAEPPDELSSPENRPRRERSPSRIHRCRVQPPIPRSSACGITGPDGPHLATYAFRRCEPFVAPRRDRFRRPGMERDASGPKLELSDEFGPRPSLPPRDPSSVVKRTGFLAAGSDPGPSSIVQDGSVAAPAGCSTFGEGRYPHGRSS